MTSTLAQPGLPVDAAVTTCREEWLTASRARVAAAADETRRRLQHDLHHGAQARLAHTVVALKLARDALDTGRSPADLIDEALAHAEQASRALGGVVRGILPTILVHGGLHPGVESLVAGLALQAEVRVVAPRLPAATETAPTSSSRRRWATSRRTRAPTRCGCPSSSRARPSPSRSPTTAWGAPTSLAGAG